MMRYFILVLLLAALIGALLGQWLKQDAGLILLSYSGLVIESSLWVGIFGFLLFFILLIVFYSLIAGFIRLPMNLRRWKQRRDGIRHMKELKEGVIAFIGGDPKLCYDRLHNSSQTESRLMAAESALSLKHYDKAMSILNSMLQKELGSQTVQKRGRKTGGKIGKEIEDEVHFLQARIHLARKEYETALKLLNPLMKKRRSRLLFDQMLREICIKTGQWDKFAKLLLNASDNKERVLTDYELYFENETNGDKLIRFWGRIPINYRKPLLNPYALALIKRGKHTEAEAVLAEALKKSYDSLLVDSYKQIISDKPLKQLHFLEGLVKKGYEDKNLLSALATLSLRNRLVTKAKDYYEKLINGYEAEPADRFCYAELLNKSNNTTDKKKAQEIFYSVASASHPLDS